MDVFGSKLPLLNNRQTTIRTYSSRVPTQRLWTDNVFPPRMSHVFSSDDSVTSSTPAKKLKCGRLNYTSKVNRDMKDLSLDGVVGAWSAEMTDGIKIFEDKGSDIFDLKKSKKIPVKGFGKTGNQVRGLKDVSNRQQPNQRKHKETTKCEDYSVAKKIRHKLQKVEPPSLVTVCSPPAPPPPSPKMDISTEFETVDDTTLVHSMSLGLGESTSMGTTGTTFGTSQIPSHIRARLVQESSSLSTECIDTSRSRDTCTESESFETGDDSIERPRRATAPVMGNLSGFAPEADLSVTGNKIIPEDFLKKHRPTHAPAHVQLNSTLNDKKGSKDVQELPVLRELSTIQDNSLPRSLQANQETTPRKMIPETQDGKRPQKTKVFRKKTGVLKPKTSTFMFESGHIEIDDVTLPSEISTIEDCGSGRKTNVAEISMDLTSVVEGSICLDGIDWTSQRTKVNVKSSSTPVQSRAQHIPTLNLSSIHATNGSSSMLLNDTTRDVISHADEQSVVITLCEVSADPAHSSQLAETVPKPLPLKAYQSGSMLEGSYRSDKVGSDRAVLVRTCFIETFVELKPPVLCKVLQYTDENFVIPENVQEDALLKDYPKKELCRNTDWMSKQ